MRELAPPIHHEGQQQRVSNDAGQPIGVLTAGRMAGTLGGGARERARWDGITASKFGEPLCISPST